MAIVDQTLGESGELFRSLLQYTSSAGLLPAGATVSAPAPRRNCFLTGSLLLEWSAPAPPQQSSWPRGVILGQTPCARSEGKLGQSEGTSQGRRLVFEDKCFLICDPNTARLSGHLRGPPAHKMGREVDPGDPLPCSEAHPVAYGLVPAASAPRHMLIMSKELAERDG